MDLAAKDEKQTEHRCIWEIRKIEGSAAEGHRYQAKTRTDRRLPKTDNLVKIRANSHLLLCERSTEMLPIVLRGIDKNTAIPVIVNTIWPVGPPPVAGMFITFDHRNELYQGQIKAVDVDTRNGVSTPYSLRLENIRKKDRYPYEF